MNDRRLMVLLYEEAHKMYLENIETLIVKKKKCEGHGLKREPRRDEIEICGCNKLILTKVL